jgi:hypothetical protein
MRVVLAVLALLAVSSCTQAATCRAGTVGCLSSCIDPLSDPHNCGACGVSCGVSQTCVQGACQCAGSASLCNGGCVDLDNDARHCGGCAIDCGNRVCEGGQCTFSTATLCGGETVNLATNPLNCGGCGLACAQGQSCRAGVCTYDLVAACFTTGQMVGLNGTTLVQGSRSPLGSGPQSLAVTSGAILAADGLDPRLYQATQSSQGLAQAARANRIGNGANQVVVDGPRVYVVNSADNTLQVLQQGGDADVVTLDGGVAPAVTLGTVGELSLGRSSFPEGVVVAGGALWVPLYGSGFYGGPIAAGQQVVKVGLNDAGQPVEQGRVSLLGLDLRPFDGGSPVPGPAAVVAHRGGVYVVLNNLNGTVLPARADGPGLLARIEPATSAVAAVQIAGARCLNPVWAAEVGERLAISCAGQARYDTNYVLLAVSGAGVALLDGQDQLQDFWSSACPADAGVGCPVLAPGRLAVRGSRLFLGDQNAGQVVVLDVSDAGLTEVRGVANALDVCPLGPFGYANVSDLVSLP